MPDLAAQIREQLDALDESIIKLPDAEELVAEQCADLGIEFEGLPRSPFEQTRAEILDAYDILDTTTPTPPGALT